MKGNKLKLFGIIAAVAVIGLSMAACDNGNNGNGGCDRPCTNSRTGASTLGIHHVCGRSSCPVGILSAEWHAVSQAHPGAEGMAEREAWIDANLNVAVGERIVICNC